MTKLVPKDPAITGAPQDAPADPAAPEVGRWFWVGTGKDRWLGCVTHVGSNYAQVTSVNRGYDRIHFDEFADQCTLEPDAERIIAATAEKHRLNVAKLMGRVRDLTSRLAVSPDTRALDDGSASTQALTVATSKEEPAKYKRALILAKDKQLPALFKEIQEENEAMANWLKASLLPLQAQAEALKPAIKAIENRIFHVELYAGLIEEVKQIADGEPACRDEKVRLFQRRAYMDEECLARYETGGMEFDDISDFDAWFVRPANLKRLLPFPRCLVAFQVRRDRKDRSLPVDFGGFIKMMELEKADRSTFLYMRNGDRVYRLSTGIDFGEKLFPDMERAQLEGKMYMKTFCNDIDKMIPEREYLAMVEEEDRVIAEWERIKDTIPENERWHKDPSRYGRRDSTEWKPFNPESVYYDEGRKYIQDQMDAHNRLILVLQGLFDRSPVFHPHSPLKLWTEEGFKQAVELVYDDSRTLVPGDKPDFEAYRAKLNTSLKRGSVTVGQDDFWQRVEAKRYNEDWRRSRYRREYDHDVTHYCPSGNPGPGKVARVAAMSRKGACKYTWTRKTSSWRYGTKEQVGCHLIVPREKLLNVDAYTPGDFHLFFDDPRSRSEYLQWAWLVLECEEYHAGNRKAREADAGPDDADEGED